MFLPRYLSMTLLLAMTGAAVAESGTQAVVSPPPEYFVDAGKNFLPLDPQWFDETKGALKAEATRVAKVLEADGPQAAAAWKRHLHWDTLEQHLSLPTPGDPAALALVRRWLFSNKPGLEDERFARLRELTDAHLDAVTAFSTPDLQQAVKENAAEAARLAERLRVHPNEDDAARLGRLLGWFDRVGQLSEDVGAAREGFSHPNVELVVSDALIQRVMREQTRPIDETVSLDDCTSAPATNRFQRERAVQVTGSARTQGTVTLQTMPDTSLAKFLIVYEGTINALCRADAGPAALHLRATGSAKATQPVYFDLDGLRSGQVEVDPNVSSRLVGVSGRSRMIRQIAERRAVHPVSRAKQQQEAVATAIEQLEKKLSEQVADALDKIKTEAQAMREAAAGLGEATAPLVREGALPVFVGAQTTPQAMVLQVLAGNRDQLGAARRPPPAGDADLTFRVHVSALNNMAETIMGGKRLNDEFFMRYGKIVHAELPVPLMVHSRATRWAVTAKKVRPLELRIHEQNLFELIFRIDAVEVDGQQYTEPSTLSLHYRLVTDALGELALVRVDPVEQESQLPASVQRLLAEKFGAFFGPTLTGGGVIVPGGGLIGLLRELRLENVSAKNEWVVVELNTSTKLIEEFNRLREEATE